MRDINQLFKGQAGDTYELPDDERTLVRAATLAARGADTTYIRFKVGAAIRLVEDVYMNNVASELERNSRIVLGANTQFKTYEGAHAETMALDRALMITRDFAATDGGARGIVSKIAVYSPDSSAPVPPCGGCRQRISELVYDPNFFSI
ncbi:MAG: hypothetical protein Q8P68_04940 [Candidatus Peregrinibacteria bacterium]|nr:hypothetical protein [Candidatus Peregrinibacteria bacterium]MDZ4244406.1 hypothetical protein [Candidatus Gracilibacteria bacterium]